MHRYFATITLLILSSAFQAMELTQPDLEQVDQQAQILDLNNNNNNYNTTQQTRNLLPVAYLAANKTFTNINQAMQNERMRDFINSSLSLNVQKHLVKQWQEWQEVKTEIASSISLNIKGLPKWNYINSAHYNTNTNQLIIFNQESSNGIETYPGSIQLWNLEKLELVKEEKLYGSSGYFTNDGHFIGNGKDTLGKFNILFKHLPFSDQYNKLYSYSDGLYSFAYEENSNVIYFFDKQNNLKIISAENGTEKTINLQDSCWQVSIRPDSSTFILIGKHITIYDLEKEEPLYSLKDSGERRPFYTPDGNIIITDKNLVKIWDTKRCCYIKTLPHTSDKIAIDYTFENILITSYYTSNPCSIIAINIWDIENSKLIKQIKIPKNYHAYSPLVLNKGNLLIIKHLDYCNQIVDLTDLNKLYKQLTNLLPIDIWKILEYKITKNSELIADFSSELQEIIKQAYQG